MSTRSSVDTMLFWVSAVPGGSLGRPLGGSLEPFVPRSLFGRRHAPPSRYKTPLPASVPCCICIYTLRFTPAKLPLLPYTPRPQPLRATAVVQRLPP